MNEKGRKRYSILGPIAKPVESWSGGKECDQANISDYARGHT